MLLAGFNFQAVQAASAPVPKGAIVAKLDNAYLRESSGICASRRNPGIYWTHNDSGAGPYIYAFNEKGFDFGSFALQGIKADDIEDVSCAQVNGKNLLLLANTGNNKNTKSTVQIYVFEEPQADATTAKTLGTIPKSAVTELLLTWPAEFGNPDCESVALSSRGEIFLATKQNPSQLFIWRTTALTGDAEDSLKKIGILRGVNYPTGLDISIDGKNLLVIYDPLRKGKVREFILRYEHTTWEPNSLAACLQQAYPYLTPNAAQPEAVCYSLDGENIFATSELVPGKATPPGKSYKSGGLTPLYKQGRQYPAKPQPYKCPSPCCNDA